MTKARATAYCLKGTMASGQEVFDGACAMSDKSLLGKTVVMYQRLPSGAIGKYIGTYVVLDTGCKKGVVDVWRSDLKECQEFMNLVYEDGCKGKIWIEVK